MYPRRPACDIFIKDQYALHAACLSTKPCMWCVGVIISGRLTLLTRSCEVSPDPSRDSCPASLPLNNCFCLLPCALHCLSTLLTITLPLTLCMALPLWLSTNALLCLSTVCPMSISPLPALLCSNPPPALLRTPAAPALGLNSYSPALPYCPLRRSSYSGPPIVSVASGLPKRTHVCECFD